MRGRNRNTPHKQISDINVTPFVDVVLVLLIVFMVTAPLLNVGVPIDLPDSNAQALPDKTEPIVISIAENGLIYIQKAQTSLPKLGARLMAITQRNKETALYIRADRKISYGMVMKVIGELSAYGFNKVSLVSTTGHTSHDK
ncbi:MAG: biopolymer transporter ExbD [Alphaproteobacteria bacterium]